MPEFQPISAEERLRVLESKYNLMRDRMFLINQNMIQEYKKLIAEIKTIDSEIRDVKRNLFELKNVLQHVIKEMRFFAKKENLKVLEKYINYWNPLNFVTENEVVQIMKNQFDKESKEINKNG